MKTISIQPLSEMAAHWEKLGLLPKGMAKFVKRIETETREV